jgi:hypothetical protein
MAPRVTAHFALTIAAAAFLTFPACSDSGSTTGQFSAGLVSSPTAAFAASVSPANVTLLSLSRTGCPTTQPFLTHMNLILGPLQTDFFMDGVTLRFADGFGARSTVIFNSSDLLLAFNTTRIAAGTQRSFPLSPQFGCGLARPQSVNAIISLVDGSGLRREATAMATFQ